MKYKIILPLLLMPVVLSLACSRSYHFVIVNDSDGPLEVKYTFKPSDLPPDNNPRPMKKSAKDVENSEGEWRDIPVGQYQGDFKSGKVMVTLAPGEALRVDRISNYPGHASEHSDSYFHIANISLTGAKGSVIYEGRQALTQFREQSDGLYVIRYE
jgi:hypothetical protein